MRLANKVAVVIGGGQQAGETIGNGRATSLRFAQEGATVLVVDIDEERANETVEQIVSEGGKSSSIAVDITNEASCAAIASTCNSRYGRIDVLHNNVGRSRGDKETTAMTYDMWQEIIDMNLTGMFLTCKHVLPYMREQNSGVIINISSTSSLAARQTITYKTTKGAINTMTQHMASENALYGIRVNAILPGLMDTPMAIERRAAEREVSREVIRKERDLQVPLNGMGTAWDVANAALFLASDEAQYITGVLLPVDGGLLTKIG